MRRKPRRLKPEAGPAQLLEDIVKIERQIISELVAAGCKYIQIDAPGYTAYVDKVSLERMRSRGEDPERNFQRSSKRGAPARMFG